MRVLTNTIDKKSSTPEIEQDTAALIKKGGRKFLTTLKQKALRANNSWFRVLPLDKRRFIDAVIQTVDRVHSSLLLKILTPLAEKLMKAIGGLQGLMGQLFYGMQTYGRPLAQRVSAVASGWGNKNAAKWATDVAFIRYLTVIEMNNLSIFKVANK
ncbi:MAG: hypothetical protein NWE93_06135 [Candidatus Bathyarchaeota archaeon]|nr:hypothetical protein [Candidatus Bathyarchaeota archaeon]